jgi:hypothetical protein
MFLVGPKSQPFYNELIVANRILIVVVVVLKASNYVWTFPFLVVTCSWSLTKTHATGSLRLSPSQ